MSYQTFFICFFIMLINQQSLRAVSPKPFASGCQLLLLEGKDRSALLHYVITSYSIHYTKLYDYIITVCLIKSSLIEDFIKGKVKKFYTYKRTRFVLLLLYRNSARYLRYLRLIDKASERLNEEVQRSYRNKELFQMMALEKSLVYFATSLKSYNFV